MKVVLSNKAYLKPDEDLIGRIEKNLTYQVFEPHSKTAIPKLILHYGLVAKGTYWLPVPRLDLLQGYETEIIDKRTYLPETFPEPKFTLREDQQEIFDEADDSCIINAKPGFGKTILALALAWKLGQKTLVVCTTTAIRDMWVSEVRKWFDIEPGIIGSGHFDHESPITIGNIQTLAKHGIKLADQFGLMIVDEMHHTPASTFTKLLMESKARYKIGLSGTLKRKDGLECLFKDFFGMKVFIPEVANTIPPTIHMYDTDVEISGNQMIPWANKVNAVMENPHYRKQVLALANCYIKMGHKVIVVSDRIEFLKYIHEHVKGRSALFIGETPTEERVQLQKDMSDGKLDIFNASQNIFSEGISQNELSCMILGSPIGDNESLLEQLAGRIMRKAEGKLDPILVDLKLEGWTGGRHRRARTAIYGKNGWQCVPMSIPKLVALNKNSFAKLLDFKV
ncbi:putative ATP-dependent protein [Vibrio phage vB_VorS-PVo5]|nr:putative ATP-dependent protein [Vibrio phage vB_VorS-PVo5]